MRRYLVVANRTLGGSHLTQHVRALLEQGPCTFTVVVPALPDPLSGLHDHATDHAVARERLEQALERFRELGAEATGWVGDRPVDAALDALRTEDFDSVIVSTLPARASRWLRVDIVSRLRRGTDVPVVHLVAEPAAV